MSALIARRRRDRTPHQLDRSLRVGRVVTLLVIGAIAAAIAFGSAWFLLWWLT